MSRLAFGGFEFGRTTDAYGWIFESQAAAGAGSGSAFAPTTPRSGTYSQELGLIVGGGYRNWRIGYHAFTIPTGRWFYCRLYWKTSALLGLVAPFFNIEARSAGTGPGIGSNSSNHFTLADGVPGGTVTTLATFAMTVTTNRWYCLEVGLNISAGSGTDDQVTARITDDVTGASETVSTVMNANNTSIPAVFRATNISSTATITIDDWAMNDNTVPTGYTAGQPGAQDGFPGPGKVLYLSPVSDVTTTGWSKSDGRTYAGILASPVNTGDVLTTGTNPLDIALANPSSLSLPYAVSCAMPVAAVGGSSLPIPGVGLSALGFISERVITSSEFLAAGADSGGQAPGAVVPGNIIYQPSSLPSTPVLRVRPTTATVSGTVGGATLSGLGMYLDSQPLAGGRRLSMLV